MKLIIQKNYLHFDKDTFPCAVGKNGITDYKLEGDGCTPHGKYKIKQIYYRADRLGKLSLNIESFIIKQNDGWCDDPKSKFYNKFIEFPFSHSAEKLFREDNIYDIVCVIDYNINPVTSGKGSAIFLHIAHEDFRGTEGCIAVSLNHLLKIVPKINNETEIDIKL